MRSQIMRAKDSTCPRSAAICGQRERMSSSCRRNGPANFRTRAEELGGTLTLTSCEPAGALLEWAVPLPAPAD
ncbi:hypothetical protein GCM10010508_16110 [Streptomyces naganishii JCM 4654]|uniref:Uncharacterized protein n=1 Tax=Streptomyces naganishii JCM 4654 TaxID=1306179 RepID=A0A918Y1Z7_9ACTN|nr:hypothetical protein GCM10010508_16110 [Streptomyces naganishii JCM 4654]